MPQNLQKRVWRTAKKGARILSVFAEQPGCYTWLALARHGCAGAGCRPSRCRASGGAQVRSAFLERCMLPSPRAQGETDQTCPTGKPDQGLRLHPEKPMQHLPLPARRDPPEHSFLSKTTITILNGTFSESAVLAGPSGIWRTVAALRQRQGRRNRGHPCPNALPAPASMGPESMKARGNRPGSCSRGAVTGNAPSPSPAFFRKHAPGKRYPPHCASTEIL